MAHIHAALMAQYAEDAAAHDKPWKLWERRRRDHADDWKGMTCSPSWDENVLYRRKAAAAPDSLRQVMTDMDNDPSQECRVGHYTDRIAALLPPEPLREAPTRTDIYAIAISSVGFAPIGWGWRDNESHWSLLNSGHLHATLEACQAACDALNRFVK